MKNRVGSKLPPLEELAQMEANIKAVRTWVKQYGVDLTSEERQRVLKHRSGGEKVTKLVADLAKEHDVKLPGISVEGMENDAEVAKRFAKLQTESGSLAQTIGDTVLQAESECWWATTAYYTALARMMDTDPKLAAAIQPAIDFFATGKRKPVEPK
ncbi:MAG: hypothetical protein HY901_18045 [Deltaproteobacteria bacterium]|nr:hypothetical protein [Deltaproteobacteria bacterium]